MLTNYCPDNNYYYRRFTPHPIGQSLNNGWGVPATRGVTTRYSFVTTQNVLEYSTISVPTISILYRGEREPMYPPMPGALYHLPHHLHQRTLAVRCDRKRRIHMENPPPAEPNGAYTLDLKTGVGQLTVGSNPTPSAIAEF